MTPSLRVAVLSNPYDFLAAVKDYDDVSLSFPLGSVYDSLNPLDVELRQLNVAYRRLWAVYSEEKVM